ncbi:MAG: 5'-nucleotidase, lipoprotein e(P4) family [Bacteroidetes bacterium GWF2_33_16]|nr:MAG: 5'-nucleotidase, lipoprotein e(P4) family [Bacteroidetes bacterium GWE2_32_14]OFY04999.1 MAG: 5'-nucleotidase, lipoprotein e(P4) family [Bacteroidetes bacterium GWF2_33_16]
MKKGLVFLILFGLILLSCKQAEVNKEKTEQDHLIMSVLWYQKSAEMRALYYQGFNLAKMRLNEKVLSLNSEAKKAVIVDIDETMLDNSPSEGKCIETGESFNSENWTQWTSKAAAKALPGAIEFSHFAESLGVEIFYISNRSVSEFEATLKNLQTEKFAYADSDHLLLKEEDSSKKSRREKVAKDYEILLLIGDNLGDFIEIFDDRSQNYGFELVDQFEKEFGDKFIILPNPMYGTWEKPFYNFKRDLSESEKYKMRKSNIVSY